MISGCRWLALWLCCLCLWFPVLVAQEAGEVSPSAEPPPTAAAIAFVPRADPLPLGVPSPVRFYVVDDRGRPLSDVSLAAECAGAEAGEVVEIEPAVYEVGLKALEVEDKPRSARLVVRANGGAVSASIELPVVGGQPPEVVVAFESHGAVLGDVERLPFTVDAAVEGWPEPSLDALEITVNVGHVEGIEALGGGRFGGTYVLPASRTPQVAMIAASLGKGPFFRWGWALLHLSGRIDQTYEVDAGARVYATIGGRRFGPVTAGADGAATLTLEVPPGAERVNVVSQAAGGVAAEATVPLVLPPFPRALVVLEKRRLTPSEEVRLVALKVDVAGSPQPITVDALMAQGGRIVDPKAGEAGVITARYRAAAQPGPAEIRLISLAEHTGGEATVLASSRVEIPAGRPERLKLKVSPEALRVDDPPAQIGVQILDGQGLPTAGGRLLLETTVGDVTQPSQVGAGMMVAALIPPRDLEAYGVEGAGVVDGEVVARLYWFEGAGEPATLDVHPPRVLMDPTQWADGLPVAVRLLDEDGLPVARQNLNGQVLSGPGTFSGGMTDGGGWVSMVYRPHERGDGQEAAPGPVKLRVLVEGAEHLREDLLILVSPEGDEAFQLPAEGPRPSAPDVVARAPVHIKAGRVKQVQITVQPNALFVGVLDTADVRVRLLDGRGNPVIDEEMSLEADAGTLGPLRVVEGGVHLATYRPPSTAQQSVVSLRVHGGSEEYVGGTEIFLKERRERLLVTSRVGLITNLSEYTAPMTTVKVMGGLPEPLGGAYLSLGLQYHPFTLTFAEPDGTGEGQQRSDIVSLIVGGAYRAQLGPVTAEGGIGVVGAGLFYSTTFAGEQRSPTQLALTPGLKISLAGEVGLGPGGLSLGVGYTRLVVGGLDLGPEGNIGGLSAELGYVVHLR